MGLSNIESQELYTEAQIHAEALYQYHRAQYKWAWERYLRWEDPMDKSDAARHHLKRRIYEK